MAGHSQFKNIMHRKGAQDKKRAKIFSKATKEIIVSVKEGGTDPSSNPRLRSAILAARSVNMPKDNIDRAIKKADGGGDGTDFKEIRYEGYGPGGIAIIIDGLTDNKNRTAGEIRSIFTKYGGNLAEANSVSFQFAHVGEISYLKDDIASDDILEIALDAGAQDIITNEKHHIITTDFGDFTHVRENLFKKFGDPYESVVLWKPHNTVEITKKQEESLLKMIDALEDSDDVQNIATNVDTHFDEN